jgi:GAF domain-containing protein
MYHMRKGDWSRWFRWWGGTVFAAICAGAAFIAQVQASEQLPAWASWAIKLGGAGATVVALLLPARQTWAEVRAKEDAEQLAKAAVTNYRLALESILLPLTDIFDRIVTAPDRSGRMEAKGAIKHAVVNSAVQFADVPRVRSCYFDYERRNRQARLVCRTFAGRGARPRTEFSNTEPNHAEIFQLLESRQSKLIENVDMESHPRFPLDENCKTYISVPVATRAEIFGLLTLDALHPGELNPQDEKEMLLLAQLLGIALASDGGSRGSTNNIILSGGQGFARLVHSVIRRGNGTT